jgi:hypothetical protein
MVLLSLDRSPPLDILSRGTLPAWVEAISTGRAFDEQRDVPRFRAAFTTLQVRCTRWPAPREFIDALPHLEGEPRNKRIDSDSSRQVGMRAIKEISKSLGLDYPAEEL